MERIGIYGGSFDPIHFGHLLFAESAREFCGLNRIVFVPAGIPPHKRNKKQTSGNDRFQMIQLAIQAYPEYSASRFEIDSNEVSYTVRTLRYFHELNPKSQLFLIIGSDMFNDIPNWLEPQEICRLASLVVTQKADEPPLDFSRFQPLVSSEKILEFQRQIVPMPKLELSSTKIRNNIATGKSIRFQLPSSVEQYILENRLYASNEST